MTSKEKIREEVEKCYSDALERAKIFNTDYWEGKADAYRNVLIQLDSLQEEPVSEDLEEAADDALSNVLNTHEIVNIRSCLEMFRYGAKWQKEQLMKNAINTEASLTMSVPSICIGLPLGINVGDKVKLIIIKN